MTKKKDALEIGDKVGVYFYAGISSKTGRPLFFPESDNLSEQAIKMAFAEAVKMTFDEMNEAWDNLKKNGHDFRLKGVEAQRQEKAISASFSKPKTPGR